MVWLFERGEQTLRLETRFDAVSEDYLLIVHRTDGTAMERFADADAFRSRLEILERQLEDERWQRAPAPIFLRDGWRL
jgi:hypothetical protein